MILLKPKRVERIRKSQERNLSDKKHDKAIRIQPTNRNLIIAEGLKLDYKEKFLPDYSILIQVDHLINSFSYEKWGIKK